MIAIDFEHPLYEEVILLLFCYSDEAKENLDGIFNRVQILEFDSKF